MVLNDRRSREWVSDEVANHTAGGFGAKLQENFRIMTSNTPKILQIYTILMFWNTCNFSVLRSWNRYKKIDTTKVPCLKVIA